MGRGMAALAAILLVMSGCGDDSCNKGSCEFKGNVSACISKDAYKRLSREMLRINETGNVSGARRLYAQGLCERFPEGTKVHVVEPGVLYVKIRLKHRSSYPDMWISPDMLQSS